MGLGEALEREIAGSRIAADVSNGMPSMPRRSRRWVGEMEEIAATFADLGLTPRMLEGAADMYRFVGGTTMGDLTSAILTRRSMTCSRRWCSTLVGLWGNNGEYGRLRAFIH